MLPAEVLPFDPSVTPEIAGQVPLRADYFERVVGETACLIWRILCSHRDPNSGLTTITYAGMRRARMFETPSDRRIERGLARLRALGLVRDHQKRRVLMTRLSKRSKTGQEEVWCFPRTVFGAEATCFSGRMVLVPGWVVGKMKKANTWGGKRPGSGRKPKPKGPTKSEQAWEKIRAEKEAELGPDAVHHLNQVGVYPTKPCGGTDLYIDLTEDLSKGVVAVASQQPQHASAGPVSTSSQPERTAAGSRIGGAGRPPPPPGTLGIPEYPGVDVTKAAIVPPAPKLPEDLDPLEMAKRLVQAFRGAVEARYPGRCWVLAGKRKLEKSKYLPLLQDAARTLIELDIAPAAWAAFSVDVWKTYEMGPGRPRISWVFQTSRMDKHYSWFQREAGYYCTKRLLLPRPARLLLRRWSLMRLEMARVGAQTEDEVRAVVEQYFPDDLYDVLVTKARRAAAADQERINTMVRRGKWVW